MQSKLQIINYTFSEEKFNNNEFLHYCGFFINCHLASFIFQMTVILTCAILTMEILCLVAVNHLVDSHVFFETDLGTEWITGQILIQLTKTQLKNCSQIKQICDTWERLGG